MRLTPAQLSVLSDVAKGERLLRVFDVYGPKPDGCWWEWQKGAPVKRRTAEALIERGALITGEEMRPYSGRRVAEAVVTDAGRAALAGACDA